jgi:GTPase Era involved in 16S rRNA processing
MTSPNTRAGFVAIVGAPNAGKSTLVNALVGSKVSIVSPKVQTTRMRVIGIAMADLADGARAQVILVDTPGIFRIAKRAWSAMQRRWRARRMPMSWPSSSMPNAALGRNAAIVERRKNRGRRAS